jgi:hypothetical protein
MQQVEGQPLVGTPVAVDALPAGRASTTSSRAAKVKWNHIVVWHAVFWLFFRNMPYLLNFSLPL